MGERFLFLNKSVSLCGEKKLRYERKRYDLFLNGDYNLYKNKYNYE